MTNDLVQCRMKFRTMVGAFDPASRRSADDRRVMAGTLFRLGSTANWTLIERSAPER
jgi:hypothetical protein